MRPGAQRFSRDVLDDHDGCVLRGAGHRETDVDALGQEATPADHHAVQIGAPRQGQRGRMHDEQVVGGGNPPPSQRSQERARMRHLHVDGAEAARRIEHPQGVVDPTLRPVEAFFSVAHERLRSLGHARLLETGDLDIAFTPSGSKGYDDLLQRAVSFEIDGVTIAVASLDDIIRSKTMADRLKDRAVLPILLALRDEIDAAERPPS